jgi:hypothetical protein
MRYFFTILTGIAFIISILLYFLNTVPPTIPLAGIGLLFAYISYHLFDRTESLYLLLIFVLISVILSIWYWHIGIYQLFIPILYVISAIGYISLMSYIFMLTFNMEKEEVKKYVWIGFLVLILPWVTDNLTGLLNYGIEGLYIHTLLYSIILIYIAYSLSINSEDQLLEYVSTLLLLLTIITTLTYNVSGLSGQIYDGDPHYVLLIYYVFAPAYYLTRKYVTRPKELSFDIETIAMTGNIHIWILLIVGMILWLRGFLSGITVFQYVSIQSSFVEGVYPFVMAAILVAVSLYIKKLRLVVGIILIFMSISYILGIFKYPELLGYTISFIISILPLMYYISIKKSYRLILLIITLILLYSATQIDYDVRRYQIQIPISGNSLNTYEEASYAKIDVIEYNPDNKIVTSKFDIQIVLEDIKYRIPRFTMTKSIFQTLIEPRFYFMIDGLDIVVIRLMPDSGLIGSVDYYVLANYIGGVNVTVPMGSIYGLFLTNLIIYRNVLWFIILTPPIFLLPIIDILIIRRYIKESI